MTTLRPAVDAAARAAIAAQTERVFRAAGALVDGHVELRSGRHGDRYVDAFAVLSRPPATSELCANWAAEHRAPDGTVRADVVAGPTAGGSILAFETARQLGARALFAEELRHGGERPMGDFPGALRIAPGERILLVDDILTTGDALLAMASAVEAQRGEVVGCHVLVDRSGEDRATIASPRTGRRYPLKALWRLSLPSWEPGPDSCPGCAAGDPLRATGRSGATGPAVG